MQGCPLVPVLFALGVLQMGVDLHAEFPDAVGGACLDDMPIVLPAGMARGSGEEGCSHPPAAEAA